MQIILITDDFEQDELIRKYCGRLATRSTLLDMQESLDRFDLERTRASLRLESQLAAKSGIKDIWLSSNAIRCFAPSWYRYCDQTIGTLAAFSRKYAGTKHTASLGDALRSLTMTNASHISGPELAEALHEASANRITQKASSPAEIALQSTLKREPLLKQVSGSLLSVFMSKVGGGVGKMNIQDFISTQIDLDPETSLETIDLFYGTLLLRSSECQNADEIKCWSEFRIVNELVSLMGMKAYRQRFNSSDMLPDIKMLNDLFEAKKT